MTDCHHFTVVSLFPAFVESYTTFGVLGRAIESGHVRLDTINPRDYADGAQRQVDDAPYGGGPGMVLQVRPLRRALDAARALSKTQSTVVYLSPQGRALNQSILRELSACPHLVLLAGRYEGVDERIIERDVDIEVSLGDYVLSGGEIPALAIVDGVARLLPEVLGSNESASDDSFSDGLLEFPQYSRPDQIDGQAVPSVLLSGDHAAVARWRRKQALGRTWAKRPDLLGDMPLSAEDQELLAEFRAERQSSGTKGESGD